MKEGTKVKEGGQGRNVKEGTKVKKERYEGRKT